MDGDSAASVYSEAKGEYTKQLTLFIVPVFHRFFMICLTQAAQEEPQAKRQLWKFQEILSQIPEWNVDKVGRETSKIQTEIQCDYLEELVTAVFIAHTKVLTAIRIGNKNKRVQITIPKLDHFLHRSLSECSRLLWSNAYLFHSELSPIEKQKNHRQIEQLLHEGIAQAIRGLLPVKNILKDYLAEPEAAADDADDEADDDEKEDTKKEEQETKPTKDEINDEHEELEDVKHESVDIHESDKLETDKEAVSAIPMESMNSEEVPPTPLPEPVAVTLPEPITPTPLTTPLVIKEQSNPIVPVAPVEATLAPATPVPPAPQPTRPTLVVDTEPSVRFTDFNQIIQTRSGETQIDYIETNHEPAFDDEAVNFLDDGDGEPLSDFEVLEDTPAEALDDEDFETLP